MPNSTSSGGSDFPPFSRVRASRMGEGRGKFGDIRRGSTLLVYPARQPFPNRTVHSRDLILGCIAFVNSGVLQTINVECCLLGSRGRLTAFLEIACCPMNSATTRRNGRPLSSICKQSSSVPTPDMTHIFRVAGKRLLLWGDDLWWKLVDSNQGVLGRAKVRRGLLATFGWAI